MTSALQILVFSSVKWASNTPRIMLLRDGFCTPITPSLWIPWCQRERGLEKHNPRTQGQQGFWEEERETWNSLPAACRQARGDPALTRRPRPGARAIQGPV